VAERRGGVPGRKDEHWSGTRKKGSESEKRRTTCSRGENDPRRGQPEGGEGEGLQDCYRDHNKKEGKEKDLSRKKESPLQDVEEIERRVLLKKGSVSGKMR